MHPGKASSRHLVACALLTGFLLTTVGCGGPQPTVSPLSSPSSPLVTPSQSSSGAAGQPEGNSPVATPPEATAIAGPEFALDRPLEPGATQVTGHGPAGIPIVIVDVTLTGERLGTGFIDDTGTFDIELSESLEAGHRIGIMAGTIRDMSDTEMQTYLSGLKKWRGEGARSLPFIGMLFDTAMVEE